MSDPVSVGKPALQNCIHETKRTCIKEGTLSIDKPELNRQAK
jgi:hypothetical protein